MSDKIDVATHGPDGHWDYEDIVRLCAYRDELAQQLAAEREARNSAEGANDALSEAINDYRHRTERAETRLAEASSLLERWAKEQVYIIGDEELVTKTHIFLRERRGGVE